jgi:energy-coupling factor transport system substrate-specific component
MEIGFHLVRRIKIDFFVVSAAGALGGLVQGSLEYLYYYPGTGVSFALVFIGSCVVSGAILGAGVSVLLVRALTKTGILATFGR